MTEKIKTEDLQDETKYFALAALSKSQMKNWNPYNPMGFFVQSAFNPNKAKEEFGDALVNGKLLHMMLFQPELVEGCFEINDELGKSRINKKWQVAQDASKKLFISSEEMEAAKKMMLAISYQQEVRDLISGGAVEKPFTWYDEEWKIPCKMRLDYFKNSEEGLYVIDYKTTAKDIPLYIDKNTFQYDIGFYARGVKARYGQPMKKFIFIFQSTKENEEHLIRIKVVEGAQLEACEIATDLAVKQIVPRLKAWQIAEKELFALRIEKDEEKRKATIPLKEAAMLRAWLPTITPETWEVSPWFDKEIAENIHKGEIE